MRSIGKIKKDMNNEDGIALVTALMLGMFGMLLVAALLLMVRTGTWMSSSQQRHQAALAASYGGNNFFVRAVIEQIRGQNISLDDLSGPNKYKGLVVTPVTTQANFLKKLGTSGSIIDGGDYPIDNTDATITFGPQQGVNPQQRVNVAVDAALVSTSVGNSEGGTGAVDLAGGGVVPDSGGSMQETQHIPALYQTRVDGKREGAADNGVERARLSSLYVF